MQPKLLNRSICLGKIPFYRSQRTTGKNIIHTFFKQFFGSEAIVHCCWEKIKAITLKSNLVQCQLIVYNESELPHEAHQRSKDTCSAFIATPSNSNPIHFYLVEVKRGEVAFIVLIHYWLNKLFPFWNSLLLLILCTVEDELLVMTF